MCRKYRTQRLMTRSTTFSIFMVFKIILEVWAEWLKSKKKKGYDMSKEEENLLSAEDIMVKKIWILCTHRENSSLEILNKLNMFSDYKINVLKSDAVYTLTTINLKKKMNKWLNL